MIELAEPLNELVCSPHLHTANKRFAERIYIYDETLRDGEQMPGVAFSPEQKLELARFLSDLGVDVIMAGFPASSRSDGEAYRRILLEQRRGHIRRDIEIICLARAERRDIDAIASAARAAGVELGSLGILVLSTTSDLHLKYKLGRTLLRFKGEPESAWHSLPVDWYRRANIDFITDHIDYCRKLGFGAIEFAAEDASRGARDYFIQWAKECRLAGGTRACFSDTNGILTPEATDYYFAGLPEQLQGLQLTAHFHNDFGLAAANTVRALGHGATHASMTACGIGERAGNAAIHQVAMILRDLYGIDIPGLRFDLFWRLRALIERLSGVPIQAHEPIVGVNVFSHESGIHTAALELHPAMYQFIDHRTVGGVHRVVFGKHSGALALRNRLERYRDELGLEFEIADSLCGQVLDAVKRHREQTARNGDFTAYIQTYHEHLENLGVPDEVICAALSEALTGQASDRAADKAAGTGGNAGRQP